jgi:hypothetical protein
MSTKDGDMQLAEGGAPHWRRDIGKLELSEILVGMSGVHSSRGD